MPIDTNTNNEPIADASPLAGTDVLNIEDINKASLDDASVETPTTQQVTTEAVEIPDEGEQVTTKEAPTNAPVKTDIITNDTKREQLNSAINTVVDLLSDKISANISKNIGVASGENIQNGFDSINKTVETMATNSVKV